jgi:hypothetical protein
MSRREKIVETLAVIGWILTLLYYALARGVI